MLGGRRYSPPMPTCFRSARAWFRAKYSNVVIHAGLASRLGIVLVLVSGCGPDSRWRSSAGMEFVLIPAGEFVMGSPADEIGRREDEDQHQVTIERPFYASVMELTQGQWREITGVAPPGPNPLRWSKDGPHLESQPKDDGFKGIHNDPGYRESPDHPAEHLSWEDAVRFCNLLSTFEGFSPAYEIQVERGEMKVDWDRNSDGFRLPTEAEWEYMARAGATGPFTTGEDIGIADMNFDRRYPYLDGGQLLAPDGGPPHGTRQGIGPVGGHGRRGARPQGNVRPHAVAVGSHAPNAWGLFDVHGNVFEWCWDWYGPYPRASSIDPPAPDDGTARVIRGGSWYQPARFCRFAQRTALFPNDSRNYGLGLRVVRSVP